MFKLMQSGIKCEDKFDLWTNTTMRYLFTTLNEICLTKADKIKYVSKNYDSIKVNINKNDFEKEVD